VADVKLVGEILSAGWASGEAPVIADFEKAMCDFTGRKHAIAVNSGTSALDIAVASLDLHTGDEVVIPSLTIISCLNEVLRSGARPVFVDVDPLTWNVTAEALGRAFTTKTKAVIVPHIYGLPADIRDIEHLCYEHAVTLIEDTAEGLGLEIAGRKAGSFGQISTLSFYANKVITSGEGGMVLVDDSDHAERLRRLRNLGFNSKRRFVHGELGWNYRMPALSAALGLSQANRIDDLLAHQIARGQHYQELLADTPNIQLPADSAGGSDNIYWVFGIVVNSHDGTNARFAMDELAKLNIGSRPFFYPLHSQPVLENFGWHTQPVLSVSENLGERGFYIPSLGTTKEQRVEVASAVKDIAQKLA